MECKRDGCQNELQGRQRDFCSDRCRKAQSRTNKTHEDGSGSTNADKSEQIHTLERGQIESGQLPDEALISAEEAVGYRGLDCLGCEWEVGANRVKHCGPACAGAHQTKPATLTMHERQCQANNQTKSKADQHTINTGLHKSYDKLDMNEHNRVSLPGDDGYDGRVQHVPDKVLYERNEVMS